MRQELKRVDPFRAANICALVYGLLLGIFVLIFVPFLLVAAFIGASQGAGGAETLVIGLALLVYPVIGAVMGWISGFLTAGLYNLVIRWSGGLLLEFDSAPST